MSEPDEWGVARRQLRDPGQVVNLSADGMPWDEQWVGAEVTGPFWEIVESLDATLLVTREYEHFVAALSCGAGGPQTSVLRIPHPSGLVVDRANRRVHVACTRNPNQIMELEVADGWIARSDRSGPIASAGLVPVGTRFLPGCMYLHDLAFIDGRLHGNAVGMNAVVDLSDRPTLAWWPATMTGPDGPDTSSNRIQLNSIAAGASIADSYFTASTERPGDHRPGDRDWQVDRRGVVFAGDTGEAVVRGLTRPHSARLAPDAALWVDDSGYGRLCVADGLGEGASTVAQLPGWTRGLCLVDRFAIAGTSRVIPGFEAYAPGLDPLRSTCGVHIVDRGSGCIEASLTWPSGNQVFAIDWIERSAATGFLAGDPVVDPAAVDHAWYRYRPPGSSILTQ